MKNRLRCPHNYCTSYTHTHTHKPLTPPWHGLPIMSIPNQYKLNKCEHFKLFKTKLFLNPRSIAK